MALNSVERWAEVGLTDWSKSFRRDFKFPRIWALLTAPSGVNGTLWRLTATKVGRNAADASRDSISERISSMFFVFESDFSI